VRTGNSKALSDFNQMRRFGTRNCRFYVQGSLKVRVNGAEEELTGWGNGPIDACRNALLRSGCASFRIAYYSEHARSAGSDADAVAFIQIELSDGSSLWGAAIHPNIELASIKAVISAVNRASS